MMPSFEAVLAGLRWTIQDPATTAAIIMIGLYVNRSLARTMTLNMRRTRKLITVLLSAKLEHAIRNGLSQALLTIERRRCEDCPLKRHEEHHQHHQEPR